MIPTKLRIWFGVLVLVLSAILTACSTPSPDVAAKVGDTEIPDSAVEDLMPAARLLFAGSQTPCAEAASDAECRAFILSRLIEDAAAAGYAKDKDIVPSTTDINRTLDQIQSQGAGADAMREALAKDGGTLDDARELIRVFLTRAAVMDSVASNFTQAEFEANKDRFATIDTAHILVQDENQAQDIKDQATPENFADLAKKYSQDPGSKDKGGELGPVAASGLVPEYSQAVLAAQPGDIIGPVKSQFGWHVIWVKDITYPSYEDAKKQAASGTDAAAAEAAFQEWVSQAVGEQGVEVNPRFGTFDAKSGEVVPPAGAKDQSPAGQSGQPPAGEVSPAP